MKSYFRYVPDHTLGVITSPDSNAIFDSTGKLAFTGNIQGIGVWNLRQASLSKTLNYEDPNYPYSDFGEVISLVRLPDKTSICAGYSSGEARIFNYVQGNLTTTFRGHRSAVTAIAVDEQSGSLMATGGADCEIIIWDLVALSGVARLHEHKDVVTGLAFLSRDDQKLLLSVSKDTLLKVWDLETRHCIQTVVGHRSEIWSLSLLPSQDISKIRVFTGSADELIRVYKVNEISDKKRGDEEEQVLVSFGAIERSAGVDRCASLAMNSSQNLLAAQSSGKFVDIFRLRDTAEAKKKMKRRLKRQQNKGQRELEDSEDDGDVPLVSSEGPQLSDEMELLTTMKLPARVRSFAFNPIPFTQTEDISLVSLVSNSLEVYKVPQTIDKGLPLKLSLIDLAGHRSDVRSLAVSSDGNSVATCSSESLKLWSTRGFQCTASAYTPADSYSLSVAFVPGGRYVICGCKDGKLKIFDFASGDAVWSMDDAHQGAIWSIAVRFDGKGFVTGSADKTAKFWTFDLQGDRLAAELDRQIVLPADVLTVRYSATKSTSNLLVAVGLLDNTVRLFYEDSLKLFLTLYGHSLPVMCLDLSYDNTLIVSGSADKSLKIWGLDFGDCHRSLFGHQDSVTAVRFQQQTHFFFSASKDATIRYWDADRFEQILLLTGHKGSIWALDLTYDGKHLFSCGQDRSIRVWTRSEDLVFIEEEKERMLEAQVDKAAEQDANSRQRLVQFDDQAGAAHEGGLVLAAMSSLDSIRSGEALMASLDLVAEALQAVEEKLEVAAEKPENRRMPRRVLREAVQREVVAGNPLLLGLDPLTHLQRSLKQIKAPDLEAALLLLPFHYAARLLPLLAQLLRTGRELELNGRVALFLLQAHSARLVGTKAALGDLQALQWLLFENLRAYRNLLGTNMMGFWLMQRQLDEQRDELQAVQDVAAQDNPFRLPSPDQQAAEASKIVHLPGRDPSDQAPRKKRKI